MKKPASPDLVRDSILAHLKALHAAGVEDVLLPSRKGRTAEKRKAGNKVRTETVTARPAATGAPVTQTATRDGVVHAYRNPEIVTRTGENMEKIRALPALRELIGDCPRCKLCKTRKNIVFGEGKADADLMFVGEGPGADEDEQGRPFVGRAGQLLTRMIEAMGLSREDVYIANIVKCRPPENRVPDPDEIESCIPFLMKQIELIGPKVIVGLGKTAVQALLNTQISITKIRGRFQDLNGVAVMPTFHPAYLLRTPAMKKFAWEDLQTVMEKLGLKGKPKE